MKAMLCAVAALAAAAPGAAQEMTAPPTAEEIRDMTDGDPHGALALFREFLALPNDANKPADILKLVEWMEPQFAARGFETQRIETAGSPALFAERKSPGAAKTALIYLQADGQPVDPSRWEQPSPWQAAMKARDEAGNWTLIDWPEKGDAIDPDWRVFARSASDSKGPMTQFLLAMDAINASGRTPGYNLKVIIDTEEELGSPNLTPAIEANRELLAADFLLIFDGPPHASNKPTVAFGARGIATVTLTAYGPKTPQHSGHYGNFAPNPAFDLARALASMKSADGRVRVKGFYDGVTIPKSAIPALAAVPDDEAAILASMGLAEADRVAPSLQEAIQYPSLNIRGLDAAWVGDESRTIIPATAVAELDIRTVKETDPERLIGLLRRHLEGEGFHILGRAPTEEERLAHPHIMTMEHRISYGAFRSDFDAAAGAVARAGMRRLYGEEPILIRTVGGSIPIAPIVEALAIPAAIVPTVNIDNNQHSPNENIRAGNFLEGIAILTSVLLSEAPANE